MSLSASGFRIHRWLGWLVGIQVIVWIGSGMVFSLLPFQAWVKGGDSVRAPSVVLPADWVQTSAAALQAAAAGRELQAISAVLTPHGPALRLVERAGGAVLLVPVDGTRWTPPDASALRRFAASLHVGPGEPVATERIDRVPARLGIVQETGGRGDLWRVSFDDALATRIYLDARSGEFVTSRNEAWVWYDFLWRLHIMDYAGGDDFNGLLLRIAAICALGLAASGALLSVLAARRHWRSGRGRRAGA